MSGWLAQCQFVKLPHAVRAVSAARSLDGVALRVRPLTHPFYCGRSLGELAPRCGPLQTILYVLNVLVRVLCGHMPACPLAACGSGVGGSSGPRGVCATSVDSVRRRHSRQRNMRVLVAPSLAHALIIVAVWVGVTSLALRG